MMMLEPAYISIIMVMTSPGAAVTNQINDPCVWYVLDEQAAPHDEQVVPDDERVAPRGDQTALRGPLSGLSQSGV